jgi:uncharacterized protein YPO0396
VTIGSADKPLFYLPGATEGTTQWKVETLQLVNWGGFHGHTTVAFAPTTTLLSGASGTGKSTLLDAYIALMMDSNIPFNGASNDATVGRARSADQRSLVSYLRGKLDTGRDTATGELADQVLRGQDSAAWGALAVTFIDDNDRRYTVARLYYVPNTAKLSDRSESDGWLSGVADASMFAFSDGVVVVDESLLGSGVGSVPDGV